MCVRPQDTITGEHIELRILTEADASEEYAAWLNDPMVNQYLETRHVSLEELKTYIREKAEKPDALLFGIFWRENSRHIGNLKLEPIDREKGEAAIGILIGDKASWGKGVATEATNLAAEYAFSTLKLRALTLGVIPENTAAIRVYEKCGFVRTRVESDALNHDGILYDRIVMRREAPTLHTAAVNIILKSFDGDPHDKAVQERALRGLKIDTCISITDHTQLLPALDAQEHIWMPAGPLRAGQYPEVDWNTIAPLDEELIEQMRECEAIFMTMIDRYAFPEDIRYQDRKRQYYRHLRYWNHTLQAKNIDLVLMNHPPHQCYDMVLYSLCKLRGIALLYFERNLTTDDIYLVEDWEQSAVEIFDRYRELQEEYYDRSRPVPLSDQYEYYLRYYRDPQPTPWYKPHDNRDFERSFFAKWWKTAVRILWLRPGRFFASIVSPSFWSRKMQEHKTLRFYERHARVPDLSKCFIYLPLHYQPEATTSPQSGAYVNQELIAQMIAAFLPRDVALYIKEHPRQTERCRSREFYESLLKMPSVTFVPKDMSTFDLIDKAMAVATGIGSAGFEAMMRLKPVLMFGHFLYQSGPGIHRIHTTEDCRMALEEILADEPSHTLRDVRLFLKAIEACATPWVGPTIYPGDRRTQSEKAECMGALIANRLRTIRTESGSLLVK